MQMLTPEEIITDTVNYYEADPSRRAVDEESSCAYLAEDGRKCAVGRYLLDGPWQHSAANALGLVRDYDTNCLVPEVRHIPVDLWQQLQTYHDRWQSVESRKYYVSRLWHNYCPNSPMPEFTFHGETPCKN